MDQTSRPVPVEGHGASDMTSLYGRHGYPDLPGSRDLRFDFMRGFAMLSVVAAHLEFFSWFNSDSRSF